MKEEEKIIDPQKKRKNERTGNETEEGNSDGSANAFDATERYRTMNNLLDTGCRTLDIRYWMPDTCKLKKDCLFLTIFF